MRREVETSRNNLRRMDTLFKAALNKRPADEVYSNLERSNAIRHKLILDPLSDVQSQAEIEYDKAQLFIGVCAHRERGNRDNSAVIIKLTKTSRTREQVREALRSYGFFG